MFPALTFLVLPDGSMSLTKDMSVDPFLWEKPRVLKKGKVQVATGHCMHLASLTQQMSACGTARVNSELC